MDLNYAAVIGTWPGRAEEMSEMLGGKRESENKNIVEYLLDIDNKYFTSKLMLHATKNLDAFPQLAELNHNYEALIICYDNRSDDVEQELKSLSILTNLFIDVDVLLFVCDLMGPYRILSDKVLEWCSFHNFELIELQEAGDIPYDADQNKYGIDRMKEALNSNLWSYRKMKSDVSNFSKDERAQWEAANIKKKQLKELDKKTEEICLLHEARIIEHPISRISEISETLTELDLIEDQLNLDQLEQELGHIQMTYHDTPSDEQYDEDVLEDQLNLDQLEQELGHIQMTYHDTPSDEQYDDVLACMDNEDAKFEKLYGQIATMKKHAESLPMKERRLAAEQVVTAFWKAMGGEYED